MIKSVFPFLFSVALLVLLTGCSGSSNSSPETVANDEHPEQLLIAGKEKFTAYCMSCHNEQSPDGARLAPPPLALQQHYKEAYADEAAFIQAMADFIHHPSKEKAVMQQAVEKFGLMPAMGYAEEELKQIASYIYHGEFSKPSASKGVSGPLQTGQELAMSTKRILGKNLMAALNEGGPVHAVDFCNTKAIYFTDSMSKAMNARIQRVSDRPRNPNNRANDAEQAAIAQFKQQIADAGQAKPMIIEEGDGFRFYGPITTNAMCLQCHGEVGSDVTPQTTQKIKERYPNDEATGYGLNQVRGIWSIYFEPA